MNAHNDACELVLANQRMAPSVDGQPRVDALSWRLLMSPEGSLHLVTFRETGALRLTSPVVDCDFLSKTLTTSSGRVYVLRMPPEAEEAARALLLIGGLISGLIAAFDVSDLAWDRFQNWERAD